MATNLPSLDGLSDPRDRLLFSHTPLLMMPKFGTLVDLPIGRRRYVGAEDGIYLQARHRALALTLPLPEPKLPFGTLASCVHLPGGLIPRALFRDIQRRAIACAPKEWAGLVHWDDTACCYRLTEPPVTRRSTNCVSWKADVIDYERLVLDVHSHGWGADFFSPKDDQSDLFGFYFACVLGNCRSAETMTAQTRLVVDGQYFNLDWHPWEAEDGDGNELASP
jgi:PRTRC genetic system protein A